MRARSAIVCAVALAVATTAPAAAAPKKPKPKPTMCYLVVDEKGDGYTQAAGPVLKSDAMDIHSADVATGNTTLVAAIRLETTESDGDPVAAFGLKWTFTFTISGEKYEFYRVRAPGIEGTYTHGMEPNPKNVKVVWEAKDGTVKWIVPRSAVPELLKPGKKVLGTLAANGKMFVTNGDSASSLNTYPDKHPHCLKPK